MQLLRVVFSKYQLGQVADHTVQIIYFVKMFYHLQKRGVKFFNYDYGKTFSDSFNFCFISLKVCYE